MAVLGVAKVVGDEMLDDGRILFLGDRGERCWYLLVALFSFYYGLYKFYRV